MCYNLSCHSRYFSRLEKVWKWNKLYWLSVCWMEVNSKLFTFAENGNWQLWTKVSLIKNDTRLHFKLGGTVKKHFVNPMFKLWVKLYSVFFGQIIFSILGSNDIQYFLETFLLGGRGDCITRVNFSTLRMWNIAWSPAASLKFMIFLLLKTVYYSFLHVKQIL